MLYNGGLTIRTTLDLNDQTSAERAIEAYLPTGDPSGRVAAIAMVEPGTGNVLAMAQNLKYGKGDAASYVNNAVDRRYSGTNGQQPGSTFKIFTIAAAIEQGLPMNEYIYSPSSREMPYGSYQDCEGYTQDAWPVSNYEGARSGNFTMYEGTAYSINTYFAELAKRTGLCNIWDLASRAGVTAADTGKAPIDDQLDQVTPGVIGGSFGMSPLTLAESYATFAARGLHCETRVITEIHTYDKQKIDTPKPDCEQVIEPEVADAVTDVMVSVVRGRVPSPTGAEMYLDRPTAGKTGTTDDYNAVWFAGYTPEIAAAVWVGDPDSPVQNPMSNVTINGTYYSYVFGSTLPGPIWETAMRGALADVPPSSFVGLDPELIDGDAVTVPSVTGLSQQQAVARLEAVGLTVEVADYTVASSAAEGTAAYTSPGAGAGVSPGTPVTLYLSSGVAPEPSPSPKPSKSDKNDDPKNPNPPDSPEPSSAPSGNGNSNGNGNGNCNGNGERERQLTRAACTLTPRVLRVDTSRPRQGLSTPESVHTEGSRGCQASTTSALARQRESWRLTSAATAAAVRAAGDLRLHGLHHRAHLLRTAGSRILRSRWSPSRAARHRPAAPAGTPRAPRPQPARPLPGRSDPHPGTPSQPPCDASARGRAP